MPTIVRRAAIWIWENLTRLVALFSLLGLVFGLLSGSSPIFWQVGLVLLIGIVCYEVGHWRGRQEDYRDEDETPTVRRSSTKLTIEGCVKSRGVCWRGRLFTANGDWEYMEVDDEPVCSDCQTPLGGSGPVFKRLSYFSCPSCGEEYRYSDRESAGKLFKKHFRRILESEEGWYTLKELKKDVQSSQEKVATPKGIWRAYESQVDDDEVSTCCFFS